jgi:signal transduction histidine kinase
MAIQLLKQSFPGEQEKMMLDTVESSAKRGADLVKQVLTFARGIKGERVPVQFQPVIRELRKIFNETFPKIINIKTDVAVDLGAISGDPTQLHQVLMNLCVNARDAMPDGGTLQIAASNVLLSEDYVRTHIEARSGAYVLIQVSDSRVGMPPNVIERIFEPFFTTKEFGKGTGLGLSTTLAKVKSHGGFINVYSEPVWQALRAGSWDIC